MAETGKLNAAERTQETERKQQEQFQKFLGEPLVRMTLSRIPAGEEDSLKLLLQETFNRGWNGGMADVMVVYRPIPHLERSSTRAGIRTVRIGIRSPPMTKKMIQYNDRRRRETEKKAERALKWRDRGLTLDQISGKLGVSSSRVSQLLAEAQ